MFTQDTRHCPIATDAALAQLEPVLAQLQSGVDAPSKALFDLACETRDLDAIEALAAKLKSRFSHLVIAGAGGSGQSGRTLACLKPESSRCLLFIDNVDPDMVETALALDCRHTAYLIISKSGSTVETLSQFYVLWEHVKNTLGEKDAAERFIIISIPGDSPLRETAAKHGLQTLDHATNIGGRFSALSVVGLLPAAFAGIDIRALRRSAGQVAKDLLSANTISEVPSAEGAALQYSYRQAGKTISVMLPYADRLSGFSSWYRQSWAESLGKNGCGTTPIRAVGTTDQHSQLQLYLDGPKDKFFTFIRCNRRGKGQKIQVPTRADLEYLRGKTTGDVMHAEQEATLETLVRHGCPVRVITLPAIDESSLGALLMHFTAEIIFMSRLLGVNAFDQPAVEEGKVLARESLLMMGNGA